MRFIAYSLLVIMGIGACAKRPYALSERSYRKQSKAFSKTIRAQTFPTLLDSSGQKIPADWVSTVNFNLRKPNYVIIHHTLKTVRSKRLKRLRLANRRLVRIT
jgi:N-acetylmuramoyl-L-alanine amidase